MSDGDDRGVVYAGDAGYGLVREDDGAADGADFYDFLGVPWEFTDGVVRTPESRWFRRLDCSGYVRMVYGYRGGIPLLWKPEGTAGLARTAHAMATEGPGVVVVEGETPDEPPGSLQPIRPGDLVFFAMVTASHISHCGIYLGVDDNGRMRFLSS